MQIDTETGEILDAPNGAESKLSLDQIQQKLARKSHKYWSNMRTNIKLADRSEKISEATIDAIRSELSDILDSGILNYPQTLTEIGLDPGMTLKERKEQLGISASDYVHNEDEKRFLNYMDAMAQVSRKSNWAWRIAEEAEEKHKLKWHPFFITLTVDPMMCDGKERYTPTGRKLPGYKDPRELWKKGREFRLYIRDLANIVCKELEHKQIHKPPYRKVSDYVTYAGVIEHGKSRSHHHGHFIVWLRAIPSSWRQCPNAGIKNPKRRVKNECLPLRTVWPWSLPGLSPALYFRSVSDIWETQYGFSLPLKDGKPMKVSTQRTAGQYITKYLSKEHKEWHHRMKATRNLGMKRLKQLLQETDQKVVEALTWRAFQSTLNLILMQTHTVPLGLLRSVAKQQSYLNKFKSNQMDLRELLSSNSGVFMKMLMSVKNGARPDRMDSSEFYDWVGKLLQGQKDYCKTRQLVAHTYIGTEYPPVKRIRNHVKIGGNEIGNT